MIRVGGNIRTNAKMWSDEANEGKHTNKVTPKYIMASSSFREIVSVRERVHYLREKGCSYGMIAKALCVPKTTVLRWCKSSHLRNSPGRPPLLTPSQTSEIHVELVRCAEEGAPAKFKDLQAKVCIFLSSSIIFPWAGFLGLGAPHTRARGPRLHSHTKSL